MPELLPALYRGREPSKLLLYAARDVAHHLWLPIWFPSWVSQGKGCQSPALRDSEAHPLLSHPPAGEDDRPAFSFLDLVKLHVLKATLRWIPGLQDGRFTPGMELRDFFRRWYTEESALLDEGFLITGVDFYIDSFFAAVPGFTPDRDAMIHDLRHFCGRLEYEGGTPVRLYPFTRDQIEGAPAAVVIDPRRRFGQPYLEKSGIPTEIIAERFRAGESVQELAEDYATSPDDVEEALRFEGGGRV